MREHRNWDKVFAFTSWLIVIAMLWSAASIIIFPPSGMGPVAQLVSINFATVFYAALYGGLAILLAYAKAFKKKKMRKRVLMATYISGLFTAILTLVIFGWTPALIDNIIITIAAAGCWLYWTFKTEYIDQEYFYNEVCEMREDLP